MYADAFIETLLKGKSISRVPCFCPFEVVALPSSPVVHTLAVMTPGNGLAMKSSKRMQICVRLTFSMIK